ncbi:MAG: Ig-like domain-containing protein [bacterium]|nr:Ig-like domain-containing protein [bacterium]
MLASDKYAKIIKTAACLFLMSVAVFLLGNFALAAGLDTGLDYAAGTGLSNSQDVRVIIANIIRIVLGFLGIIAVSLIIYAGWLWMTSEGNEEKVTQAKKILINAVIGLIIILSSFAIASFVLTKLGGATGGNTGGSYGGGGSSGGGYGASGGKIVDYTFPADGQENVPRNLVQVSAVLNEPINRDTFTKDTAEIQVYTVNPTAVNDAGAGGLINQAKAAAPDVVYTTDSSPDGKTLIFSLSPKIRLLGSPDEIVWYSVVLKKDIKKPNGDSLFTDLSGLSGDVGYHWQFAVGTVIDDTPPKILSVIPRPDETEPRNVVVQINFNEAINPTSASGKLEIDPDNCETADCYSGKLLKSGFNNILVTEVAADGAFNNYLAGNLYISNQYRTVEFLTFDQCGVNSCGNAIYCLPADKRIKVLAKAATIAPNEASTAVYPYDGVVDMAGNSLDGNGNGDAQGPMSQSGLPPYNANNPSHDGEGDDYVWTFNTSGEIDAAPPIIDSVSPSATEIDVDPTAIPQAVFNKTILSSSLSLQTVELKLRGADNDNQPFYYLYSDDKTVFIGHNKFEANSPYFIQLHSGIKDIYQNCYFPCSSQDVTGDPSCCNGEASADSSCNYMSSQ